MRTAFCTVPFTAQAVTVHCAACPRWMLAASDCTLTHSCAAAAVVVDAAGVAATGLVTLSRVAVVCVLAGTIPLSSPESVPPLSVPASLAGALPESLAVPLGSAGLGESEALGSVEGEGEGEALEEVVGDGDPELDVGVSDGRTLVEVPVGLPVEVVGLGEGDAVTVWHCWLLVPVTAMVRACVVNRGTCWVCSAAVTIPKLDADTARKPPAAMLTAGRTCRKRMEGLPCFVAYGELLFGSVCYRPLFASFVRFAHY